MSFRRHLSCAVVSVFAVCAGQLCAQTPPGSFAVAALGCLPYARFGSLENYERLIAEINRHSPAFTVHLGDIIGSDEKCTDDLLLRRRDDFNRFESALVYTPGDNEWTDTHNEKAGHYDPLERLAKVRQIFFSDERSLGRAPIPLISQRRDPKFSKFVENARWVHGGVVFVTVHAVGSRNNSQSNAPGAMAEFHERDAANEAWIRAGFAAAKESDAPGIALFFQAAPFAEDRGQTGYAAGFERFLKTVEAESRAFAKPVLLVHADEHRYRLNVGVRFHATAEVVPNVTRIETFGEANVHGLLIIVDPKSTQVFAAGPLIVPGNPLPILPRPKTLKAGS